MMNGTKDPEGFWVDSGSPGDGVRDDSTELYHRFDLLTYHDNDSSGTYNAGDTNWWDDPDSDGDVTNNVDIFGTHNHFLLLAKKNQLINIFSSITASSITYKKHYCSISCKCCTFII